MYTESRHHQFSHPSPIITTLIHPLTSIIEEFCHHARHTSVGLFLLRTVYVSSADILYALQDPTARIFIVLTYESHARAFLCEAYKRGLHYPNHLIITTGWYEGRWWLRQTKGIDCTGKQHERILELSLSVYHFNFYVPDDRQTTSGITGSEFKAEEDLRIQGPPEYNRVQFSPYCYDAVWTLAYALNETLKDFSSSDIRYSNNAFHDRFLKLVNESNFVGITGPVRFSREGIRATNDRQVFQLRNQSGGDTLDIVQVGEVVERDGEFQFDIFPSFSEETLWPAGVPLDGVPINDTVTLHVSTTTVFFIFATAGIIFTVVCLVFNFYFRNKKLVKLSSPNLNYLICAGAIILYVVIYLQVLPVTGQNVITIVCGFSNWLFAIGYSLCFGTIICKMIRIHYIFSNPKPQLHAVLKDWKLVVGVSVLVAIDCIILTPFAIVEGVNGAKARLIHNRENPSSLDEESGITENHYVYICDKSRARSIFLGILIGYKALLQFVAVILAFTTRKVKVKGVNDSKYVAVIIYVTSLILAVSAVASFVLTEYLNAYASLFALGLGLGATTVIAFVFIPNMIMLYKDPEGKHIFKNSSTTGVGTTANGEYTTELTTLRKRVTELEQKLKSEDDTVES